MEQGFEAQTYDAACMAMGEAVWQLVITSQSVSQEAIARMILELSDEHQTLGGALRFQFFLTHIKLAKQKGRRLILYFRGVHIRCKET